MNNETTTKVTYRLLVADKIADWRVRQDPAAKSVKISSTILKRGIIKYYLKSISA